MNGENQIHILCYGDSNTWGCIGKWEESDLPSNRFDPENRWPCVAAADLGAGFHVVEEGLGGRTTIYSRPGEEWKAGDACITACIHSHRPLDLVILMLGTNDLHVNRSLTEQDLPVGISRLVDMVRACPKTGRGNKPPQLLLIAPPEVRPSDPRGRVAVYDQFRRETGRALSLAFPRVYAQVAGEKGCWFLNGQDYTEPGPADGVHITPESHVRLGHAVAGLIREKIYPEGVRP